MFVDFFAREPHHIAHAKVLYDALPERGDFFVTEKELAEGKKRRPLAVFCYGDLKIANQYHRKIIYSEHGAGMYYNQVHPSYAGSSEGRESVILRLVPNENAAARDREILTCPIEIVGMPMMDKWVGRKYKKHRKPVIAISFHWDCRVCPETMSTFPFYRDKLLALGRHFKVMGHAHPKVYDHMAKFYKAVGIKPYRDFDDVLRKADLYVCDNSSTIYQFAFTGKPVVLLNAPWYRKGVEHPGNPRFWKHADIGKQVDNSLQLISSIEYMLSHKDFYKSAASEAITEIFTFTDGTATERAVKAIQKHCL